MIELNLRFPAGRRRCPLILQSEAAECGLACLAMIAGYYGFRTDLINLRARFAVTMRGMTVADIIAAASRIDLSARALRVDMVDLSKLRLPCVGHWNFNHFVVIVSIDANSVRLNDPARGERVISIDEFSESFTGIALEFVPSQSFTKKDVVKELRIFDMLAGVSGIQRSLLYIAALSVCLEFFVLLLPIGFQLVVDQALVNADIDLLLAILLSMIFLVVLQSVASVVRSWSIMTMGVSLGYQWAAGLFGHLVRLPVQYFETRHTGDVVSRFQSLEVVQETISTEFVKSLLDGILIIGACVLMVVYGGLIFFVVAVTTTLYLGIRAALLGTYQRATDEAIAYRAKETSHFLETMRGISTIKMTNSSEERRSAWLNMKVDATNATLVTSKIDIALSTLKILLFGIDRAIIIYLGAGSVISESISVGALVAFISYRDLFQERVTALSDALIKFRMLSVHKSRLADIAYTTTEDEGKTPPALNVRGMARGEVRGDELSFRYSETSDSIIKDFEIHIQPGESVVLTGSSGCGKTTLLRLLCGLLQPVSGRVRLDGLDINRMTPEFVRSYCSCVLQDDQLFAGSIAQNICSFSSNVNFSSVHEAARLAAIDEEIRELPMGYETLVGDMGNVLSGGQKQRVALARALYRKPLVLFLDEATSNLDERNESAINGAIRSLSMTRIMVAHRTSTIALADRQICLTTLDGN